MSKFIVYGEENPKVRKLMFKEGDTEFPEAYTMFVTKCVYDNEDELYLLDKSSDRADAIRVSMDEANVIAEELRNDFYTDRKGKDHASYKKVIVEKAS